MGRGCWRARVKEKELWGRDYGEGIVRTERGTRERVGVNEGGKGIGKEGRIGENERANEEEKAAGKEGRVGENEEEKAAGKEGKD